MSEVEELVESSDLDDVLTLSEGNEETAEIFQYLTFCLAEHVVGVRLTAVKEVMGIKTITILPRTPEFMRGVINLRGQIIPVIDLRLKFDMAVSDFTVDSCIIIIEVNLNDKAILVGALADSVRDVVELSIENVDPAPKMGGAMDSKFIAGMSRHDDEFYTMLNINTIFSIDELLVGADTGTISASVL